MDKDFDVETRHMLDSLGAEPLNGSGFEDEPSEPDFESNPFNGGE